MNMFNRTNARMALIFSLFMCVTGLTYAAQHEEQEFRDFSKMEPSGTVELDITSVKLIAGAQWGSGTLRYGGKDYPLKVRALSVGGAGIKKVKASGNVYELKRLEDFAGKYGGGVVGATAGTKGAGTTTLENGKRVVLQLSATDSAGLQLSLSLGGVEIEFDN
jgi:hypothetical protein